MRHPVSIVGLFFLAETFEFVHLLLSSWNKKRKMNCKSSAKKNKPIDYRMFHLTRSLSYSKLSAFSIGLFFLIEFLQQFIFLPFFSLRRKKKKKDELQNVQKFSQKEQALYFSRRNL